MDGDQDGAERSIERRRGARSATGCELGGDHWAEEVARAGRALHKTGEG